MPPVISTVPAAHASGMVSTTLPTWRAWLKNRYASRACRTSHDLTGSRCSASVLNNSTNSASICAIRCGPASIKSKAR
ncbi:Uncharacterised protein [Mycobacterium tuberculosis]|uniref:Uncharacterized protein n=1 Tax=Mycobacterium tuberculosis TaxID=1773 RepID=A0A916P7J7_MYCTX|nr:Uncharacterised protein [Mycobacterium tuberculosis]COX75099.1 Uncharacterised protein [Mycobacterium tuberculosis]